MDLDNDFAKDVLPVPGTSSRRTCPEQKSAVNTLSITSSLPTITFEMLLRILSLNSLISLAFI